MRGTGDKLEIFCKYCNGQLASLHRGLSSRVDPGKGERWRLSMLSDNTGNNYVDNCNHTRPTDNATCRVNTSTDDKDTYCKRNLTIPILDHLLISDENVGTHHLLATNYLYRVPAVINKEQSLKNTGICNRIHR